MEGLRLIIANQMLSVIGSIQPDPFHKHVPKRTGSVSPEFEEANKVLINFDRPSYNG